MCTCYVLPSGVIIIIIIVIIIIIGRCDDTESVVTIQSPFCAYNTT